MKKLHHKGVRVSEGISHLYDFDRVASLEHYLFCLNFGISMLKIPSKVHTTVLQENFYHLSGAWRDYLQQQQQATVIILGFVLQNTNKHNR